MVIKKKLAMVFAIALSASMVTVSLTGCNKKEEETEEEPEPEEEPEEEPAEEPAEDDSLGEVKTYPDMTKAGGTFRLLRQFNVHAEADAGSKKLTRLASGTLVDFKNFYRDWILVMWPSGPGELSPGWIQTKPTSSTVTRVVGDDKKDDKKEDDKKADETDDKKEDDKKEDDKKEDDKKEDDKKEDDKKEDDKKPVKPKFKLRLPKIKK